ncbi:MAG: flagellar hook-associated protein FlgK [Mizugakiibacter sp.]|uniref:flagellar hook-associated protein FlgK n=1 Tax=Mizugakiibacter sp. TaxID=1972610 RepID=UPI00320FBF85
MADMLSTGISGLLSSQIALDTTSHNIANVNTDGYSRQRADFVARPAQQTGPFYVGQGTTVQSVQRLYDQYLTDQVRGATSGQSRFGTFGELAGRVDNLLADQTAGLQPALDAFYGAIQDLANYPADSPTRQALLGQANALTARFHGLAAQFDQLDQETSKRIGATVGEINGLGRAIARLNDQVQAAQSTGATPHDLLDQRDALVKQLAADVGVSVVPQDDDTINVFVGNGQPLVLGNQASTLGVVGNAYDPTRAEVTSGTPPVVITGQLSGGTLGGLVDFRTQMLDPTRNQLGRSATALAQAFNAQHRAGMDANGQMGGDFFSLGAPTVLRNSNNTGGASVTAAVADVSGLTASDYVLSYDGSAWSLRRSDGTAVAMTGSGTAADPFLADGLSLQVGGAASAGDRFMIQPTRGAAGSLAVAITDPGAVAAAVPVRASAAASNTGSATLGAPSVTDATDPNLQTTATITFASATTYQINGGAVLTLPASGTIGANGWSVTLTGTPAAGDTFTVAANSGGVGDNGNALALGNLADAGVLDGGNTSVGAAYGQLVAQVGSVTAQAKTGLNAQTGLLNQATQAQSNVSGVNLDEEASNLVRYQQSYQASARVIAVADSLFQTLLGAVSGS